MTQRQIRTFFHRLGKILSWIVFLLGLALIIYSLIRTHGHGFPLTDSVAGRFTATVAIVFLGFPLLVWFPCKLADILGWLFASVGQPDKDQYPMPWQDSRYEFYRELGSEEDAVLYFFSKRWGTRIGWVAATIVAWIAALVVAFPKQSAALPDAIFITVFLVALVLGSRIAAGFIANLLPRLMPAAFSQHKHESDNPPS